MAVIVDKINHKGFNLTNAYVKVRRIWGSTIEGWNALIGVAANKNSADQNAFLYEFNVKIDFVEANPYPLIYDQVKKYFVDQGCICGFDTEPVSIIETVVVAENATSEVIIEKKSKKKTIKKNVE